MKKQTVEFATVVEDGVIKDIGHSSILEPKVNYNGKGIKWYPDRYKEGYQKEVSTQQ